MKYPALLLCLFLSAFPAAYAEQIVMPIGDRSCTDCPERGMSMESVQERFGEPQETHSAVGEPPITRWVYAGFTVYFENNRVIHAVGRR